MPEVLLPDIPDYTVRLTDYGTAGDGRTDNTEAFRRAIEACSVAGGGRVIIPPGVWLTGPLKLTSRLELHAEAGAVVRFSRRSEDYPLVLSHFEGRPAVRCQSPLDAENAEHLAITGRGVFDGGGEAWRPVKNWKMTEKQWNRLIGSGGVVDGEMWWPTEAAKEGSVQVARLLREGNLNPDDYAPYRDYLRPNLLSFRKCRRILLEGPTFQNSAAWNLHPWACEHLTIRGVTVRNPWFAQNGDGLDLDSCRYAVVEKCSFDVGDDAICMKSGKDEAGRALGLPTEYVAIRGCTVYHGHGGFVIGSEMSGGVRHIEVSDCTFMGTDIGLRFKSARGRGGTVEDIAIERIRMTDIAGEAISFHLFYEGKEGSEETNEEKHPVSEKTPVFRRIDMRDLICDGAETALLVNGLEEMPLEDVTVRGFTATAKQGAICRNAKGLSLEDVRLYTERGPLVKLHHCSDVDIVRLAGAAAADEVMLAVSGERSDRIVCRDALIEATQRKVSVAPEVAGKPGAVSVR